MQITDLPLIVFGGRCHLTGKFLDDCFEEDFSTEKNLWGAVSLTRQPIKDGKARVEVPVGQAALQDPGALMDPQVKKLQKLEQPNKDYCAILGANGKDALTRKNYNVLA